MLREPEILPEVNDMQDMVNKLSEIFRLELDEGTCETPDQKFILDLAEKVILSDDPETYKYTQLEKKEINRCWEKYAAY